MAKVSAATSRAFGIRFYPSIYCIAADGTVHSVPDDRMPSESVIEELLLDVALVPDMPEGRPFDGLRGLWEDEAYGKLRKTIERELGKNDLDAEVRAAIEEQRKILMTRAARQVARVQRLGQGPDFFAAERALERIEDAWDGFDAGDQATAELKRFGKDPAIKAEIKAGKTLARLIEKFAGDSLVQQRKLAEALTDFAQRFEGTHAAARALALRPRR